ncbi:MAG: hexose kinase [Clostridia bacterium]|nr:hexose kinase [Clostridia bacterium]
MKVYTVTLNPAYDVHATVDGFAAEKENFATVLSRDAGGKGVNVSRALLCGGAENGVENGVKKGVENTAIVVIGSENGDEFKNRLQREGLRCVFLERAGRIRENLTLHAENGQETRISFSGFTLDDTIFDELDGVLDVGEGDIVAFTGSVPSGVSINRVKSFLKGLKDRGVRLAVDSRSLSIADITEIEPWLVKPNEEEFVKYFGVEVNGFDDCVLYATELSLNGVENVMVSLGERGAMLAADGLYIATPPKIKALSTIGAGDSSIAGFISAFIADTGAANCVKTAVAYGTAACLTDGTNPPKKSDIDEILKGVQLREY